MEITITLHPNQTHPAGDVVYPLRLLVSPVPPGVDGHCPLDIAWYGCAETGRAAAFTFLTEQVAETFVDKRKKPR